MAHQNRRSILPHQLDSSETLAEDVVATWIGPMTGLDWPKRLELMGEVARLVENRPGLDQVVAAKLIHRLGGGAIACREQALFYQGSADESCRLAAERWLAARSQQ